MNNHAGPDYGYISTDIEGLLSSQMHDETKDHY